MSRILPLHKEIPNKNRENYRRISLLPEVSLIFEHFHFDYISSASKDKLNPKHFKLHFNFQTKRGAVLQLLTYLEIIYTQQSDVLYVGNLDFAKGFDKVPHNVVINKIHSFGFDDHLSTLMIYMVGH